MAGFCHLSLSLDKNWTYIGKSLDIGHCLDKSWDSHIGNQHLFFLPFLLGSCLASLALGSASVAFLPSTVPPDPLTRVTGWTPSYCSPCRDAAAGIIKGKERTSWSGVPWEIGYQVPIGASCNHFSSSALASGARLLHFFPSFL